MSRSEEFHGEREPEYRVYTRNKDGESLYLEPDVDGAQSWDYTTPGEALDHVGRSGMGWQYTSDGEWKRSRISHHEIVHLNGGLPVGKPERYPAGWKRGDTRE